MTRQAAALLRERFGATRVVVFGSLVHMTLRPAVIDGEAYDGLDELRRFSRLFRHAYSVELDPLRLAVGDAQSPGAEGGIHRSVEAIRRLSARFGVKGNDDSLRCASQQSR